MRNKVFIQQKKKKNSKKAATISIFGLGQNLDMLPYVLDSPTHSVLTNATKNIFIYLLVTTIFYLTKDFKQINQ